MPGLDEVEVGIGGGLGVDFADVVKLEVGLGVYEGGFEGSEAGLTPSDGGELVDVELFGVVAWFVAVAEGGEVFGEGFLVFDAEDDVNDGGKAMFERIPAGYGLSFGGDGALGFATVNTGLLGAGGFIDGFRHSVGDPFHLGHKGTAERLSMNSVKLVAC